MVVDIVAVFMLKLFTWHIAQLYLGELSVYNLILSCSLYQILFIKGISSTLGFFLVVEEREPCLKVHFSGCSLWA